jgi:hypothetical protein
MVPTSSASEDSDGVPVPDPDDNGAVQVVSGNGFQIVADEGEEMALGDQRTAPGLAREIHVEYSPGWTATAWMTEADKKMLEVEGHEPVPWERFGDLSAERGEHQIRAAEMRRDDDFSVVPSPHNDVITSTVLVVWRDTQSVRVSHCRELRIPEGQLAYMPRASVSLGVVSHPSGAWPSKC